MTFARFLTNIIKLRAQFSNYPIKRVRLDNDGEFTYMHSMIIAL